MNIALVNYLAAAANDLEEAREQVEIVDPAYSHLLRAQRYLELLLMFEVTGSWPDKKEENIPTGDIDRQIAGDRS